MAEGLKLKIGADVGEALQGMTAVEQRSLVLQKSIARLQTIIGNTRSPQQLSSALAALSQRQAELNKITAAAPQTLNTLTKSSGQATLALFNLGRVAQDAPFGFLGIANNLNPLLESFQRLKATTGTTGGALKALGKSLTGAGGLGFALSIASSLAIVFGDKLFGASKKAEEHKEAIQLVETEYDRFAKRLNEVSESIAKEATSFAFLTAYSNDATVALKLRNAAISEINKNYSSYLSNLSQEVTSYNELSRAIQDNIKYLAVQAELKALLPALNKDFAKAIQLQVDLNQLQRARALGENNLFGISEEDYQKESKLLEGQIRGILNSITAAKKSFEIIAGSSKGVLDALFPDLGKTTLKEVKVKIDKIKFTDTSKIGVDIIPPDEFKPVATSAATLFSKEFTEYFKKPGVIDFSLIQAVNDDKLNKETKDLAKDLGTNFSQSFRDAINSGISSIGEGIGNVLSGQDFGSSITDAFSGLLSSLGKALIEYGLIKEGLDKILGPGGIAIPGAVAIGLGVLAIAASTALKNIGGARASGGPVAGNTPYLVGERGPELFTPSVSGSIIPNNQIGSFSGRSQMATVRVTGRLRGNDMILQNARTNRMQTRLG